MYLWQRGDWPRFFHDAARTEAALARLSARLGMLNGIYIAQADADRRAHDVCCLTQEAQASFAIEGAVLPQHELAAAFDRLIDNRAAGQGGQNRVEAVAAMIADAASGRGVLTAARLFGWHRLLFHGVTLDDVGAWQRCEMVTARSAAGGLYVAPPAGRVGAMMDDFLAALAVDGRPAPIRAAVAHVWFDAIQPFLDGNGRIGRAIALHILAREVPLSFSMSARILDDKLNYYRQLVAAQNPRGRGVDVTDFALWLLGRLTTGADEALSAARSLVARNRYFARYPTMSPRARHVLGQIFGQGPAGIAHGLSAAPYAAIAGVSAATATRDLAELDAMGAVTRGAGGGRSVRYFLTLDAMD